MSAEYANSLHQAVVEFSPLLPFIVGPAGLALVVWLTRKFFPGSQGSGIPQTIAAINTENEERRGHYLSIRLALGKFMLTVIGLFSGASVGREGPTVQIGASIMQSLGRFTRFSRVETKRGLILAGGAAGVAAAFNTPLAGIVFAIEEMSRNYESRTSGTVLTSVIVAGIVSIWWLGDYTYFGTTSAILNGSSAWIPVIVCGVIGGVLGGIFSQLLIFISRGLPGKMGVFAKTNPVIFAAFCGFLLAIIGAFSGSSTYGTGYHEARMILEGTGEIPESFGILKLLATLVSYVSGIPGGVFAPSLAVGAGLGQNIAQFIPYVPLGAVVVLGMVAYFAGVVQAPVTAFVIVMEMTDNHDMIVPLMAASLLAAGCSKVVCRRPLYRALADEFLNEAPPKESKS
ncbi:MAG: chloride channel protein [Burkholderiales bacterium]|nr:chloride channel protein [Burkholderiales bacterium]MBL6879470.1 chloride channel protein [Burkholderiales bacterium]MBT5951490.1 chloride channel protein [Betaproteobacteria bacterium]